MNDVYTVSPQETVLTIVEVALIVILIVRWFRYARKFDRYFRQTYPDATAQLKKNYPSWIFKAQPAPLFSISLVETAIVKDEKLRRLRRKAIWSFVCLALVMVSFHVFSLVFVP